VFNDSSVSHASTFDVWLSLINNAQKSIDIASLYWTLRQSEVYPDPSSIKVYLDRSELQIYFLFEWQIIIQGEKIFQALLKAGTDRGVTIRIAQNAPTQNYPNVDTEFLVKRKAAQVRSLNFVKILGGGVLHTKMWIIDRQHVYIGSANMDWRSLTQVILSKIKVHLSVSHNWFYLGEGTGSQHNELFLYSRGCLQNLWST